MWKTTVAEWMTTPVITAVDGSSLADIQRIMESHRIHQVPIVRNGMLVGLVTQRAIHKTQPVEARLTPVEWRSLMAKIPVVSLLHGPPLETPPDADLHDAAQLMITNGVTSITVTMQHRPVGMITISDLFRPLLIGMRGAHHENHTCSS